MKFNVHSDLRGKHAFLSPSQYHWVNDDDEKFEKRWRASRAVEIGTKLHALAEQCISFGVFLKGNATTLALYVNDAIKFKLKPEVILYYSPHCFGTADAIRFDTKKGILRIHDLKTGTSSRASFIQLELYAALFCLEYGVDPFRIQTFLRIYQYETFEEENPDPEIIQSLMDLIVARDERVYELESEYD